MLENLPFNKVAVTRQISGENRTGEKGNGNIPFPGQICPTTAEKLKVHPFIRVKAGDVLTLADIKSSGIINQMWITAETHFYSELILRMYWDDEEEPSVECPLGMFFANGFDSHQHAVNSLPVVVIPRNACNCYWSMPFRKSARITLTNEGGDMGIIAYKFLYHECEVADDAMYFHAQYRRSTTTRENPVYTILDGVKGQGRYIGTYLAWNATNSDWWGEGEVKFYIDGDTDHATLSDSGTEDYFGGSFGFSAFNTDAALNDEHEYSTPFLGMPLALLDDKTNIRKYSLYRWHIFDDIGFFNDLRVTIDTISLRPPRGIHAISEEISSVAYWYQKEEHQPFPVLPDKEMRYDR